MQKPTIQELLDIIAHQAIQLVKLQQQNHELAEIALKHENWIWQAKGDANYPDNVSFDVVWADALKALKRSKLK